MSEETQVLSMRLKQRHSIAQKQKNFSTKKVTHAVPACHAEGDAPVHPDHTSSLARMKKVRGQVIGIEKMISDRRYCVDLLIQFRAVFSALRVVEASIFETHLKSCVQSAFEANDPDETHNKVNELIKLFKKR